MDRCRDKGYVVLVEGESDNHTLWLHRISALGVPGASTFRPEWADCLKGLKVYIHKEPDTGGETFVREICEALSEREFGGEVFEISIPVFKDPSDLHISGNFDTQWGKVTVIVDRDAALLMKPEVLYRQKYSDGIRP